MAPAASAVFDTAELLEQILSYLPVKNLAKIQIVCRSWKDAISHSTKLKQLLFQVPAPLDSILLYKKGTCDHIPFISKDPSNLERGTIIIKLHPLLEASIYRFYKMKTRIDVWINLSVLLDLPSGEWENMYASQPPCPKSLVSCAEFSFESDGEGEGPSSHEHNGRKVDGSADGFRIRHIVEPMRRIFADYASSTGARGRFRGGGAINLKTQGHIEDTSRFVVQAREGRL